MFQLSTHFSYLTCLDVHFLWIEIYCWKYNRTRDITLCSFGILRSSRLLSCFVFRKPRVPIYWPGDRLSWQLVHGFTRFLQTKFVIMHLIRPRLLRFLFCQCIIYFFINHSIIKCYVVWARGCVVKKTRSKQDCIDLGYVGLLRQIFTISK
jgi:hypothetical protein